MLRNAPKDMYVCFNCKNPNGLFIEAKGGLIKTVKKGNAVTFEWLEYRDPLIVCSNCGASHGSPVTKPT